MTTYTEKGCPFKDDCADPDHHHIVTKKQPKDLLQEAGFSTVDVTPNTELTKPIKKET